MMRSGRFAGYRHSKSARKPVLYATLSALLLKHLYGVPMDPVIREELDWVLRFQSEDGLFRDPVIACKGAETEDSWGWRHLTLHSLMTLSLYGIPAGRPLRWLARIGDPDRIKRFLDSQDWGDRVAWTSNALQNLGVMLQYGRDSQGMSQAAELLSILYEGIESRQDERTGLFGPRFDTPETLSLGVQAGYHFWLLHFYDGRPIRHADRIIDSVLRTQNLMGGFGVEWNSTACEDIDSIDPLVRLGRATTYRKSEVQAALARALPAVLRCLNPDGGWVFRRNEPLEVGHPQMYSAADESNLFHTWFRTLGLAYCLTGMERVPSELEYEWNFARAPGHQFL